MSTFDGYVHRMKPDNWRCSLCGRPGTLTLRVPKKGFVHFETGDSEDEIVPLIIKLHQGKCQDAWDDQFPADTFEDAPRA